MNFTQLLAHHEFLTREEAHHRRAFEQTLERVHEQIAAHIRKRTCSCPNLSTHRNPRLHDWTYIIQFRWKPWRDRGDIGEWVFDDQRENMLCCPVCKKTVRLCDHEEGQRVMRLLGLPGVRPELVFGKVLARYEDAEPEPYSPETALD